MYDPLVVLILCRICKLFTIMLSRSCLCGAGAGVIARYRNICRVSVEQSRGRMFSKSLGERGICIDLDNLQPTAAGPWGNPACSL